MRVSQEVRQAALSLAPQYREQFAHGIFPSPAAILRTGSFERACRVLWRNRPPDGLLEGGALRRAGWAVVAVDDLGNLKAAAYGAVPCDMLPGQISRDGEDYAAAMAVLFTMDPLTLHIDCEGTIATVNGPKCKALGATHPRAHVWSRLLASHDQVRAVKVKGHATVRDVEAGRSSHLFKRDNDFADIFAKKGPDAHKPPFRIAKTMVACASLALQAARWAAEAHVLLRIRGWDDTKVAATRTRTRPARARLKRSSRRLPRRPPQARYATGWPHVFPRPSRKTVLLTHALFVGTACSWGTFSTPGAGLGPPHHFLCQVWGDVLGASRRAVQKLPTASRRARFAASQTPVWFVSQQTLPKLDSGASAETNAGGGRFAGGAAGMMRGWFGTHSVGANYP